MGLYDDILGTKGAAPAAAAGSYDDILKTPAAAPTPSRLGLRRLVADPTISAVKGAIGLTEAGVGIADIATGGEAGKAAEKYLGYKPKQARKVLDTLYSPAQQEANQRVAEADGVVGKGLALIQNPSVIGHTLIESAPSMIGGGGVARGLLKVAPKIGGTLAGAIGEGVMSGGSTAEQIRQDTGGLDARQAAISAGSGALTAGLGLLGGKVAKRLGLDDVDTAIATGSAGEGTRRGLRKSLIGGAVSEGLLEEAPQSAQEQAAQNLATGKPIGEGVGAAAVTGAITGGLMGGGAAVALDLGKPKKAVVPEHISAAVEAATEGAVRAEELAGGAEQVKETLVGKVQEILNPAPEEPVEVTPPRTLEGPTIPQEAPQEPEPTRSPLVDRVLQTGVLQIARGEEPSVELQQALADQGKMLVDAGLEPSGSVVRRNYKVVDIPEEGLDGAATQGANPAEKEAAVLQPAEAQAADLYRSAEAKRRAIVGIVGEKVANDIYDKTDEQLSSTEGPARTELSGPGGRGAVFYSEMNRVLDETLARLEKDASDPQSLVYAQVKKRQAEQERKSLATMAEFDKREANDLADIVEKKNLSREQQASIINAVENGDMEAALDAMDEAARNAPDKPRLVSAKGGLNGDNQEVGITEDGQRGAANDEVAGSFDQGHGQDAADGREDAGGQEVGLPPLQSGAQRFAYDGNDNIVVVRKGDRIALIDQKNQQLLGLASIEDGRFGEWEEGKEPATPLERVEAERVLRRHLGEAEIRFSRKDGVDGERSLAAEADSDFGARPAAERLDYLNQKIVNPKTGTLYPAGSFRESANSTLRDKLSKIAGVFGHDVTLLADIPGGHFDGGVFGRDTRNVYISESVESPHLAVLGHELTHQMQANNRALYVEFVQGLAALKDDPGLQQYLYDYHDVKPETDGGISMPPSVTEEWAADVMGRSMSQQGFWDAFYDAKPSLAAKVATFVHDLIESVKGKLFTGRISQSEKTIKDFRKVDALAADIMKRYAESQKPGGTQVADGEMKYSARVASPQGARELLSSGTEVAFKTGAVLKHLGDRAFRFIFPEDRIIKAGLGTFRFNPIHEMLRNLSEYKARQAGAATDILSDVHTYAQEFKKVLPTEALRQAAAKLAFLESVYQLDGSVPLAQQWIPEYKDVPDTHPNAPEGATKKVQTNQWTPPNVKGFAEAQTLEDAYAEVRAALGGLQPAQLKAIRALQDHVREADLLRREALKEKNNFLFGAESEEALAANEMIDKVSRLAGRYMPLTRFGDYLVRVYEGDTHVRTESFESRSAAVDFVRQMREGGKTAELDKKQIHDHEAVNIPASFLDKIQKAAEASGLSGKNLEDFVADYKRQWAATLPDSSLRANEVRRSNMAGFDTDLLRVYEHHMQKFANAVPKIRYGVRVESTFRDMRNAIAAKAADQEFAPETVQEMLELHDSLYERQHIAEKERINSIVRLINKGVFLNYLVSPSVWLVQWSQPFMITLPKLASRFGFTASVKMFNQSAKEYLGRKYSDAKIQEFDKTHDRLGQKILTMMDDLKLEPRAAEQRLIRDRINALYNGLTAEERALLVQKMMILRGGNDLAFSHDVTDDVAGATKMERGANWITEKGGIFMRESETGSRRAANLAAFKLEFAQSKDFAKASDYAMEVVDDTLYNFGKENRAGWMQGNAGRLIGMFQYFRLHTIAKEMQLVRDAIGRQHDQALASAKKGITSQGYSTMIATVGGETQYQAISPSGERFFSTASEEARASMPAEVQRFFKQSEAAQQAKLEARKELAFQMAMTMSFAGASGTPLAMMLSNTATDALWAALQHLFGDPDDPITLEQMAKAKTEELVGEDAANVLSRGIFALANIDVSRRIGMGGLANLVPGDPPPGLSGSRRSEWYAARILGPTWGMMTDQMRATEALSNGETGKALQYASPKILKDLMKAYDLNSDGVSSATGKTVLPAEMISPWGLALQMAGINPMDVTLAREEAREVSNISTILSKRRSRLVSDFEKAYSADDIDGREEALAAISEWGQKNPKLAISQRELVGAVRKAVDKRAGKSTRREEIAAEVLAGAGG